VSLHLNSGDNITHPNCSLGHSKKGYTNQEIGVEWIKHFDSQTKAKANGKRRLLLVDGHNSHYTRGFLEYARLNRISVLCYPSHSTHLYQGLDVVIFSVLKRAWSKHRDEYERKTGRGVDKTTFLAVYAKAHLDAFTEANIRSAFRLTGVVPFNPDVIKENMLAPSRQTSTNAGLPVTPQAPVRIMSDLIHRTLARQAHATAKNSETRPEIDGEPNPFLNERESAPHTPVNPRQRENAAFGAVIQTPLRMAISELGSTSETHHLISPSPFHSSHPYPLYKANTISPFRKRYQDLLSLKPTSVIEAQLQRALAESEERDETRKQMMVAMQATTVLQNVYVTRTNTQLHAQEEKIAKKNKKNKKFKGRASLLTADRFFEEIVELEAAQERAAQEKEQRKAVRETHGVALSNWKKQEDSRKERNEEVRRQYQEGVKEWEEERDCARAERRRPAWTKPKMSTMEKGIPRPKKPQATGPDSEEEEEEEEEGDDDDMHVD